jgi:hypothetical protein
MTTSIYSNQISMPSYTLYDHIDFLQNGFPCPHTPSMTTSIYSNRISMASFGLYDHIDFLQKGFPCPHTPSMTTSISFNTDFHVLIRPL